MLAVNKTGHKTTVTIKKLNYYILIIMYFIVAIYTLILCIYKPIYDWDMIMYIASAKSYEESNIKTLHTFTYKTLQDTLPESIYSDLIQGECTFEEIQKGFRRTIYTDLTTFKEFFPFYQIRPLYTGAIYILYKAGINIAFATHILPGMAVAVALIFLYLLSVSFIDGPLIYTVPFLPLIFDVVKLAERTNPDGLAFLSIIVSTYFYLKRRDLTLICFLPILISIRTDLVLFTIPLLLFMFITEKPLRGKIVLSISMNIFIYFLIVLYWENPGWSTIFYITLIHILTHPLSAPPTLTFYHYIHALIVGISKLPSNTLFMLYSLISAYSFWIIANRIKTQSSFHVLYSREVALSSVCFIFILSHFLLFPVAWNRFFAAPYVVGTVSFLIMITHYFKSLNGNAIPQRGPSSD